MPRIVAVCPAEYPGVSSVFKNGDRLGLWKHIYLKEEIPACDFLILGAWHNEYGNLISKHKCAIFITSTFGQMEFSNCRIELAQLTSLKEMQACGQIRILAGYKDVAMYTNGVHFPYPFDMNHFKNVKLDKLQKSIGVFLPSDPRKNTINQMIAALLSGWNVYTNLDYDGPKINKVGWLVDDLYFKLISQMTMTLHCTFTESFSYAAAESISLGTLPIVSLQIAENLGLSRFFVCDQCDSTSKILNKIKAIADLTPDEYNDLLFDEQLRLYEVVSKNNSEAKNILDKLV